MKIQGEPFRKVMAKTAAETCDRVDLSAEAQAVLLPELTPQGYLSILIEREQISDAVRFMAFSLPIRESTWWACVVAHTNLLEPSKQECDCLERAASWVYQPTDGHRRSCFEVAESANFEGAAAYAALAAFWSGGSLSVEGMPEVPADPGLGPIGVGASILLATTSGDPVRLGERFETAMTRAFDIANGGNGWLEGDLPIRTAS